MSKQGIAGCTFESHNCDGTLELYRLQQGPNPEREVRMCRFHGQIWPKVGADPTSDNARVTKARRKPGSFKPGSFGRPKKKAKEEARPIVTVSLP